MAADDPLRRLQILQRDLVAFTESRLPNVERLAFQLDASAEDFKRLLARNRKNEASRAMLVPAPGSQPGTIRVDDVEYQIQDQFRQDALLVADELDLDEMEAAKLCIQSPPLDEGIADTTLPYRALLRFHQRREILLDCLRLLLHLSLDLDFEDDRSDAFRGVVRELVQGEGTGQAESSAYWRRCVDGLSDVEQFLRKITDHKQMIIMTGQALSGDIGDALQAQRQLLTRQHEFLGAILSYLIRGNFVQPEDYRAFLSKAAALEAELDVTIHYIPVLMSGAAYFGSDLATTIDAANDLHSLFATGPGQLQWRQADFKAAATMFWLAEYNSRFGSSGYDQDETAQNRLAEERSELFLNSLEARAMHFVLTAATYLKPIVWYDPSRVALVSFLLDDSPTVPSDVPPASEEFAILAMRELQVFTDALVTNMPDTLRKLKEDEDEQRRGLIAGDSLTGSVKLDLERFMVIMGFAYQDEPDAARDFWSDRESNLYGFLRWASTRLPTPRVAAFCQLLRSLAGDEKSANQVHRFLLDDTVMTAGKQRRTYSVSWAMILSEVEIFVTWMTNRVTIPLNRANPGMKEPQENMEEPETEIMLDAYLGLATHVCRISSDARNWILKDQSIHLGELMIQLAKSDVPARFRSCGLDLLSALLVDKIPEVRNGMWALLDAWISGSQQETSSLVGLPDRPYSAKQYLQGYSTSAEACASLVNLLNALVAPVPSSLDSALDIIPFPEQLGASHRHAGIDVYVDFVLETIFARKIPQMFGTGEASMVHLLRYDCLVFVHLCLSTFNEDIALLANSSGVGIESAMETKSLANYVRLHPFARIMAWLLNTDVVNALFAIIQGNFEDVNNANPNSPIVQSTIKAVQILNLAWKLQPTYFDLVRPALASQTGQQRAVPSSMMSSVDELFLPRLDAVFNIAIFTTSSHMELGLKSLDLFQKISSSRRLAEGAGSNSTRARVGSRVLGAVAPSGPALTLELRGDFIVEDWDVESEEMPPKFVKAKAILDLLISGLNASDGKPCIAHCLLGFHCQERNVKVLPHSAFALGNSLFHAIASCAVDIPVAIQASYKPWLLAVKRGCVDIVLKLANSSLTANLVRPELRAMEFLAALSRTQLPVATFPLWDGKVNTDPNVLLDSSALAIRDFMRVREFHFELCAVDLRAAAEQGSFSIQERIVSALLGTIKMPSGEQMSTASVFELFDFFELETTTASDANCRFLADVDLSGCLKNDPDTIISFDVRMAEELLILRKREMLVKGTIKEPAEEQQVDDEIRAIQASLTTMNSWNTIQDSRLSALEAWTDLLSLMITKGGLGKTEVVAVALQGVSVALPRFEKSLSNNSDAAALLAKLILTFTSAISPALHDQTQQTANVAVERLQSIFRVSLKAIIDSGTDLALRDVCYRTSCAILASASASASKPEGKARGSTSPASKQLLQLVQSAGDRLMVVVTEDAFAGRGVTRISALLFLDGLIALFQQRRLEAAALKALSKLNFVPVLIDTSIGNLGAAFGGGSSSSGVSNNNNENDEHELPVALAYLHTALALLLRVSQTADGAQLVLDAGFLAAVDRSRLFHTDPDLGLDVDNPAALTQFYRLLAAVLRVVVAAVLVRGPPAAAGFLQTYRSTVHAVFKRVSRNAGPSEIGEVAEELGRLILVTGFLETDEAAFEPRTNGFT